MEKKKIVLKTHGLRNSREVGIVVLPESFYIKVDIENNGDFYVEFFDWDEIQLFSVCHNVTCTITKTPSDEEIKLAEKKLASYIVDSLAKYVLDEEIPTYNTEQHLDEWAKEINYMFIDFSK